MSEYKGIRGFKVQTLSTDPAASVVSTGTWASANPLNTGRRAPGGSGTQTAGLAFGGRNTPTADTGATESYNGSTWTEVNDLNTARRGLSGNGTQTAAIAIAGYITTGSTAVESWDGTNWTNITSINSARAFTGSTGDQTAALYFGGYNPSALRSVLVEFYNGTTWTEVNDLNRAITSAGCGTTTAALSYGGSDDIGPKAYVESWNGTSWTNLTDMNTARSGIHGVGTQTSALGFGGNTPPYTGATEFWNGTSWTELNDMATARGDYADKIGTTSAAVAAGGEPVQATVEEWTTSPPASFSKENLGQVFYNSTSNAFKVTQQSASAGTWASGGTMNTGRQAMGGFGSTNNAQLIAGGYLGAPGSTTATEKYNGTTWTTDPATLNTARYKLWGFGNTQDAGIVVAGEYPYVGNVESYNGTSWTEVNDLNTTRSGGAGGGVQTSAIYTKGDTGSYPFSTASESWNGTSWTSTPSTSTGTAGGAGAGTSNTSALVFAGDTYNGTPGSVPTRASAVSETWNGSSWTTTPSLNTGSLDCGGFGTATSAIKYGGANAAATTLANTEYYNGTSWTEVNDMADAARYVNRGTTGSSISGLQCGGLTPISSFDSATEEWTAVITNSTITVS